MGSLPLPCQVASPSSSSGSLPTSSKAFAISHQVTVGEGGGNRFLTDDVGRGKGLKEGRVAKSEGERKGGAGGERVA